MITTGQQLFPGLHVSSGSLTDAVGLGGGCFVVLGDFLMLLNFFFFVFSGF